MALAFIACFCLVQFWLMIKALPHLRKQKHNSTELKILDEYPLVTIQLPIFNEQYVVKRLLDNIALLDYPKDKIQIQVLDDSTDVTIDISKQYVDELKQQGFDIEVYHRVDRQGYKAGALKAAMPAVKGEYIAIFDADFLPKADFLKQTMPHFEDKRIGVVQTRWGHINQSYSLLTRLQAFQLNVHFVIEQFGRYLSGLLLQFNGTAGVWRKEAIDSAGGWEADTLTEDLDLSYRAQILGWKIKYLNHVESPAELPSEINSLKSQQYRWMKGGAENAKKLLPTVWKSNLSFTQKFQATIHLLGSSTFLAILTFTLISVPLVKYIAPLQFNMKIFAPFILSTFAMIVVYYVANVNSVIDNHKPLKRLGGFILFFPVFLTLSMAMALHNSRAVIQGWLGKQTPFIRTPKYNLVTSNDKVKGKNYKTVSLNPVTIVEGLLCLYFAYGIYLGLVVGYIGMLPIHIALLIGYGFIFYLGIKGVKH